MLIQQAPDARRHQATQQARMLPAHAAVVLNSQASARTSSSSGTPCARSLIGNNVHAAGTLRQSMLQQTIERNGFTRGGPPMNTAPLCTRDWEKLRAMTHAAARHEPAATVTAEVNREPTLTSQQSDEVDDRQDMIMMRDSAEGRPPTHRWRIVEWRWFLIVGPILIIAAVTFAITRGISIAGLALAAFLTLGYVLLAGWPTWGAGLLRGGEERDARKQATRDVQATDQGTNQRR